MILVTRRVQIINFIITKADECLPSVGEIEEKNDNERECSIFSLNYRFHDYSNAEMYVYAVT